MRHRVLVVDDDPLVRRAICRELEAAFDVVPAADGEEAVRVLHGTEEISAVVSDYQLGAAMDGLAVLRVARDLWPSCVRVLVSGSVCGPAATEAQQQGVVHAVFGKPWDYGAVRTVLEEATVAVKVTPRVVGDPSAAGS